MKEPATMAAEPGKVHAKRLALIELMDLLFIDAAKALPNQPAV